MRKEFLEKLVQQLDLPRNVTLKTKVEEIEEWDSLSVVSFGAMALTEYDVFLTAEEVSKALIIEDLYNLVFENNN